MSCQFFPHVHRCVALGTGQKGAAVTAVEEHDHRLRSTALHLVVHKGCGNRGGCQKPFVSVCEVEPATVVFDSVARKVEQQQIVAASVLERVSSLRFTSCWGRSITRVTSNAPTSGSCSTSASPAASRAGERSLLSSGFSYSPVAMSRALRLPGTAADRVSLLDGGRCLRHRTALLHPPAPRLKRAHGPR